MRIRERAKQDRVHHAENGRVSAASNSFAAIPFRIKQRVA